MRRMDGLTRIFLCCHDIYRDMSNTGNYILENLFQSKFTEERHVAFFYIFLLSELLDWFGLSSFDHDAQPSFCGYYLKKAIKERQVSGKHHYDFISVLLSIFSREVLRTPAIELTEQGENVFDSDNFIPINKGAVAFGNGVCNCIA